jgi:selenocysteine-specific elongation factor
VTRDLAMAHELRGELHLRAPVVAFPSLRFILRRQSPMTLLGGGYVEGVDVAVPSNDRDSSEQAVVTVLRCKGLDGAEPSALAFSANLREDAARAAAERLVERGDAIRLARPEAYVDAVAARRLLEAVLAQLDNAHRHEPWAMGVTSIALARAAGLAEAVLVRVVQHFVEERRLVNRGGYYALLDHVPALTQEQRAFFDALVPVDESQPLLPIPFAGAASALKLSRFAGLSKAFDTLLARGEFVKIGDDLYRGEQIAQIRARIETHFREHERMTASQFRDMLGTSRKYAVPLLEWLDVHGVTIRDGDYRKLRKARDSHSLPHTSRHSAQ